MSIEQLRDQISPKFTQEVLDEILAKKSGLSNIQIDKIRLGEESKKGDSYLSNLCRFSVDITGKDASGNAIKTSVHVIVKFLLSNIARRKTFRSADFFENEAIFYNDVWPALDEFQKGKLPENEQFQRIPLLLASHIDGQNDFIALEDLSFENFQGLHRGNGLDFDWAVTILQVFARFHAVGLAYKQYYPAKSNEVFGALKETYFHEKFAGWYLKFQNNLLNIVRDAIQNELPAEYVEKVDKFMENDFFNEICKLCRLRGKLACVTHGDAWLPNFLMQSGNNSRNVAMIDFQLTRYTSLSNDITFFLISCVDMNLVEKHWDDFMVEYHKELVRFSGLLGADLGISLADLHQGNKDCAKFILGMCTEALVMSMLDDDDVSDLDAMTGEEAVPLESVWIVHPYKEEEKRKRLAKFIKLMLDKQWIV